MNRYPRTITSAIVTGALLLTALVGCASPSAREPGKGTYEGATTACEVTEKEAIGRSSTDSEGNSSSWTDYRVFTTCGVFGVQDDIWIGQWNSADTYGSIVVGKTYDFEAYGWRNGFTSTFPNILKATEVAR